MPCTKLVPFFLPLSCDPNPPQIWFNHSLNRLWDQHMSKYMSPAPACLLPSPTSSQKQSKSSIDRAHVPLIHLKAYKQLFSHEIQPFPLPRFLPEWALEGRPDALQDLCGACFGIAQGLGKDHILGPHLRTDLSSVSISITTCLTV